MRSQHPPLTNLKSKRPQTRHRQIQITVIRPKWNLHPHSLLYQVCFFSLTDGYKFKQNNSTEQWLINQKPFFFVRLPFLLQKLFCISFLAPASVAGSSKPAENKEQMVYLRCVDSQGKVYLIPQKMVTKVIFLNNESNRLYIYFNYFIH